MKKYSFTKKLVAMTMALAMVFTLSATCLASEADEEQRDVTTIELHEVSEQDGVVCYVGSCEIPVTYTMDGQTTRIIQPALATLSLFTNRAEGEMKIVVNITASVPILSASVKGITTFGDWGSRTAVETKAVNVVPLLGIELVQEFSGFNPYIDHGTQHVAIPVGSFVVAGGAGVFGPLDAAFDISRF